MGRNEEATSLSKPFGSTTGVSELWITFQEAKDMELGYKNSDIYTVKATLNMIRMENAIYKACPSENCKKKVIILYTLLCTFNTIMKFIIQSNFS